MCQDSYTSSIPKCIPDGEYLLRIQQLGIHNPGAPPQVSHRSLASPSALSILTFVQFYISCAQIKVTNGGSTTPSPTVSIPGAFKANDPGYTANVSIRCQLSP